MPQPGTEGRPLTLQPYGSPGHDYSHGVYLVIVWKCEALLPLRFLPDYSLLGKALLPWQNPTLTLNLGVRLELAVLAREAQYSIIWFIAWLSHRS